MRRLQPAALLSPAPERLPTCPPAAAACLQDPGRCTQGVALTPSPTYPAAASRECSLEQAQPNLPSVSRLIVGTPQVRAAGGIDHTSARGRTALCGSLLAK